MSVAVATCAYKTNRMSGQSHEVRRRCDHSPWEDQQIYGITYVTEISIFVRATRPGATATSDVRYVAGPTVIGRVVNSGTLFHLSRNPAAVLF